MALTDEQIARLRIEPKWFQTLEGATLYAIGKQLPFVCDDSVSGFWATTVVTPGDFCRIAFKWQKQAF